MPLTQAANAPVDSVVHQREQWSELTNIWDPKAQSFDLSAGSNGWMYTEEEGSIAPTSSFTEIVYRAALTGKVSVITIPEHEQSIEPGSLGKNLLSFQQDLARKLSANVVLETGDLSYHAKQFAPDGEFIGSGFRTQFAKVLPPHYDLGLYYQGDSRIYTPAHITVIAWGIRGDFRKEVTNYFFDIAGVRAELDKDAGVGMPLRSVAPAMYCLERESLVHSEAASEYRFPVTIPESAITVFSNRGLAHGAQYAGFDAARKLNRALVRQEQQTDAENPDIMVPIDVLLL